MAWINPYYHPEKLGLTIVGTADVGGGYEFDLFVVWKDQAGAYRWAYDAGCSCPTPFDGDDLESLPLGTAGDALNDLKVWIEAGYFKGERNEAAKALIETLESAHVPQ